MTTSDGRFWKLLLPAWLAIACMADAAVAHAETDEQRAVTLFEKARRLARDGRCNDAIPLLLESIQYAEGVGPLLNLGNCYESLGKTASAHRYFVRAQEVASARGDARRDEAAQRARQIEKDVSVLVVHVPAAIRSSAEIRVDGDVWPRERWDQPAPIDPGSHSIEVSAPPNSKQRDALNVRGKGDHVEWMASTPAATPSGPDAVTFKPTSDTPPPKESSDTRMLGFVVGGAGALGVVTGAIFGVVSISAHSSVVGRCPTYPTCSSADRTELDDMNSRAKTSGTVSTVAVIAGLALLAGGAALVLTSPSKAAP